MDLQLGCQEGMVVRRVSFKQGRIPKKSCFIDLAFTLMHLG